MTNLRQPKQIGFTIVELLIVIVVIAILATISVVAYNGIQNRANDTAVQADIRNFANKVKEFNAINGRYPSGGGHSTLSAGDSPVEGIDQFSLARGAYSLDHHNFYYCEVNGTFAVGAVSRSGNRFYYRPDVGLGPYSGNWGTVAYNCPGMLGQSGWTYSYAFNTDSDVWAPWSQ